MLLLLMSIQGIGRSRPIHQVMRQHASEIVLLCGALAVVLPTFLRLRLPHCMLFRINNWFLLSHYAGFTNQYSFVLLHAVIAGAWSGIPLPTSKSIWVLCSSSLIFIFILDWVLTLFVPILSAVVRQRLRRVWLQRLQIGIAPLCIVVHAGIYSALSSMLMVLLFLTLFAEADKVLTTIYLFVPGFFFICIVFH